MNDQYKRFDQATTDELQVIRHGFFYPWYELTDGQYRYGKLTYMNSLYRYAVLETALDTWTVKRKGMFSRSMLITNLNEEEIGSVTPEIWTRKVLLALNNGFEATFVTRKIMARAVCWTNTLQGDMLDIETKFWGFKNPFKVILNMNLVKTVPEIPLLTLIGVNLVLLRQAAAAAAVSG